MADKRATRGPRGRSGHKGQRGARGARGRTGSLGRRWKLGNPGRKGPKGLTGFPKREVVLEKMETYFDDVYEQLKAQMGRITQLQADIDLMAAKFHQLEKTIGAWKKLRT